jgi:hypothetical protein
MGSRLILLSADDWEGLFIDGELIDEGHEIRRTELVKAMKTYSTFDVKFEYFSIEGQEWLEERGSFPMNFCDIPEEFIC